METLPAVKNESMFFDVAKFEHAQRVAKVFTESTMVPEHFRGNIGNALIAMNYADRIGADLFMTMQNMCVIHGKPGVEGKLVIALVNNCGRFDPVEFEEIGDLRKPTKESDGCIAYAKDLRSGKMLKGPLVDWAMVKAEGWLGKNGSKWKTMAPLMFRYRAATYFARTYCPEVLLGMQTREELMDVVTLRPNDLGEYETNTDAPAVDLKDKDTSLYTKAPAPVNHEEIRAKAEKLVEDVVKEAEQKPAEPRTGTGTPAYNAPPEGVTIGGKKKDEQPPEQVEEAQKATEEPVMEWDPRTEPLMGKYYQPKADAVKAVAKEMGIQVDGRLPKDVHADILAAIEEPPETEEPAPKDELPAGASTRETFFHTLESRGFDDEKLAIVNDCIQHHVNKTGLAPAALMKQWLTDINKFLVAFESWKNPDDGFVDDPPSVLDELRDKAITLAHQNETKWNAICKTMHRAGMIKSVMVSAMTEAEIQAAIDEFEKF